MTKSLPANLPEPPAALPDAVAHQRLVHDLEVHLIELEMQNEELRRTQLLLEETSRRYADLYEFAPVGYLTLSADTRIAEINLTAANLLGTERRQLLGRHFARFVAASDHDRWHLFFASAARQDDPRSIDLSLTRPDGSFFYARMDCLRLDREGSVLRTTLTDMTERKRAETDLAKMRVDLQQLVEWQVARHTAAALAHEVNQPLASLSALCEAARRMLATAGSSAGTENTGENCLGQPPMGSEIRQILDRMATDSERAGDVVRHLLESLHQPGLRPAPMSLAKTLHDLVPLARASGFTDCEFVIDVAHEMPLVSANPLQMEKILLNLIRNSVDALQQLRKPAGRIWIDAVPAANGAEVSITFRDEGPGIPAAIARRIFNPFFTTKANGLGMGLTICRSLVEAQGGRIWVEVDDGADNAVDRGADARVGATFCLTLPLSS